MKKKKWIYPILILLCIGIFAGYIIIDRAAEDTKAPVIDIVGDLQLEVASGESEFFKGVSANDNRDGNVTDSIVVAEVELIDSNGTLSVTYAAFDSAGNVAKASRTAVYTDYEAPKFTLKAPLAFSNANFDVRSIVGAEDKIDGNIQHRVRVTTLGDEAMSAVGTYDLLFRVTNSLGDSVEIVLPAEVYPAGKYNASLTLSDYLIYLPVGADFDENDYIKSIICYGDEVSLRDGSGNKYLLRTHGSVDTSTPGVYAISYEVVYNQIYTGYSKLIVIVEG